MVQFNAVVFHKLVEPSPFQTRANPAVIEELTPFVMRALLVFVAVTVKLPRWLLVRLKICVPAAADKAAIEATARASAEVARYADGAPVKKVVIVPGRLVNVVV